MANSVDCSIGRVSNGECGVLYTIDPLIQDSNLREQFSSLAYFAEPIFMRNLLKQADLLILGNKIINQKQIAKNKFNLKR